MSNEKYWFENKKELARPLSEVTPIEETERITEWLEALEKKEGMVGVVEDGVSVVIKMPLLLPIRKLSSFQLSELKKVLNNKAIEAVGKRIKGKESIHEKKYSRKLLSVKAGLI